MVNSRENGENMTNYVRTPLYLDTPPTRPLALRGSRFEKVDNWMKKEKKHP